MYNIIGSELRISRIMNPYSGRAIIAAVDQGLVEGGIDGISPIVDVVKRICKSSPEAVVLSPGSVSPARDAFKGRKRPALILRIDAVNARKRGTTGYSEEIFHTGIISPLEALKIGVDGLICFFFAGHGDFVLEGEMIQHLSECSYRCRELGMPLIAEAVPVNVENEYDPELIRFAVRIACEAGADLIVTNYTGDAENFGDVLKHAPVPLFVRGGPDIYTDADLLSMAEGACAAGAQGVMLGKKLLMADEPDRLIRALSVIIHEDKSVKEALAVLET